MTTLIIKTRRTYVPTSLFWIEAAVIGYHPNGRRWVGALSAAKFPGDHTLSQKAESACG
jgi:hypothetical protein